MRLEFEAKNWKRPKTAQKVSGTTTLRKKKRRRLSPVLDLEAELGAEVDAALAEYDDGRIRAADARSAADVMNLARGRIRGVRAGQQVGSIP